MYESIANKYAVMYGVPINWILAIISTESDGNPNAYRWEPAISDSSYGLMQLLYGTATGLGFQGSGQDLYDPDTNIQLGTRLLADLIRRYGSDFRRVYSAYNSGNPDGYLTSASIRSHVERAVSRLESLPTLETAAAGAGAVFFVCVMVWYWIKRR